MVETPHTITKEDVGDGVVLAEFEKNWSLNDKDLHRIVYVEVLDDGLIITQRKDKTGWSTEAVEDVHNVEILP